MSSESGATLKEVVLGILTAAAGLWNVYLLKNLLDAASYSRHEVYYLPVAALFLFSLLFSLLAAFSRSGTIVYIATASAFLGGLFFVPVENQTYFWLVVAASAVALFGANQIRREAGESAHFRTRKILKEGLPIFFTGFAVLLAAISYSAGIYENTVEILPRPLYDRLLPYFQASIEKLAPGFRPELTVDEYLLEGSQKTASENGIKFDALPSGERKEIIANARKALGENLGVKLTGSEKLGDLMFRSINDKAAEFAKPYQRYLPFAAAFGVFVTVKTLTLPIYWLILLIMFFVVKLLIALGFIKEQTETIQTTRLVL